MQALQEARKAVQLYGTERLTPDIFKGVAMMAKLAIADSYMIGRFLAQREGGDECRGAERIP